MSELYRGFTLNVTGDPNWGGTENTFHKAIIDKLLDEYIPLSQKASANGVATLDGTTKIPVSQLPDAAVAVVSVNTKTGTVVITPDDLDDSSTTNKFVSQAQLDALHTHSNKAQLDLVTDGDHDVRTDNPHGVDKTDVGLSNVPNLDTTDAVNNEHDHSNKTELDLVTDGDHDVRTDNPHTVTSAQVGLGDVVNLKSKLDGTVAPAIGNDDSEGYAVGSMWFDITNDESYTCLDASTGAAIWKKITNSNSISDTGTDDVTAVAFQTLRYNPSNGTFTISMPATGVAGDIVRIKNVSNSLEFITISGNGNYIEDPDESFALVNTFYLSGDGISITWEFDGSNWLVI